LELAEHAHAIAYTHSAIGLALVEQALQFDEAAVATIENARRQLEEQQQYYMLTAVDAFAADLAARQGRVEEALRWVARERRAFVDDAFPTLYAPGLAFVRVLLAGGSEEQLREARVWLDRQAARAVQTHNILVQIEAQTLAAVLAAAEGDRPQAVQALAQALALAERGQAIRPFLDYAPQLAALFDEPALTEPAGEFAARVRTAVAFEQEASVRRHTASSVGRVEDFQPRAGGSFGSTGVDGQRISRQVAAVSADGPDLSTLLTYREMDVLRLLDQRLTNKEIAQKLGITTETVRQHTVNLFRKLNVDNRRQAVVVAHKLHFFDEPA
jgi:LuxR family maltose regulon positive regulatory protein